MSGADLVGRRLAFAFERVRRERMIDVPMLNPRLAVQAVGFRDWQGDWLGILITPWFMNLMLLPGDGAKPDERLQTGSKRTRSFPSGSYEFIAGEEEGVGPYEACSLFSPVFEFEDQTAAVATAEAVLQALMDAHSCDTVSDTGDQAAQHAQAGRETMPEAGQQPASTPGERLERPMSRRELLRGAFLRRDA